MAARKLYSDEEKAFVYLTLVTNDWNIYRTAKDTGIPRGTIQDWKQIWEKEGVPPELEEIASQVATSFVEDAEKVRNAALKVLYDRVRTNDITTKDLYMIVGILDDKITRGRTLVKRSEPLVVELPDIKELSNNLGMFLHQALEAAQTRQGEIIEAEAVEIKELPESTN